ncbi:unnamed protein product, partial [marine sediment metagenome]
MKILNYTLALLLLSASLVSAKDYGTINALGEITKNAGSTTVDDICDYYGTDEDWCIKYDEAGDDELQIISDSATDTTLKVENIGDGDAAIEVDELRVTSKSGQSNSILLKQDPDIDTNGVTITVRT